MKKVEICEGFSIKLGNDGIWFNYSASNGLQAFVNLKNGGTINQAIISWAREQLGLDPNTGEPKDE